MNSLDYATGEGRAMKTIQSMPDIWDSRQFTTSRKTVLGALASWAVQQSPYVVPNHLTEALQEFDRALSSDEYFETSCKALHEVVRGTFEGCPSILAWNNPRKGSHTIVFSSRYDTPHPDYDFIDLDALARNVSHAVTLEEKYRLLHFIPNV
jgi:hypothetical protein